MTIKTVHNESTHGGFMVATKHKLSVRVLSSKTALGSLWDCSSGRTALRRVVTASVSFLSKGQNSGFIRLLIDYGSMVAQFILVYQIL